MGWRLRASAATLTVVALVGGYLVLDAHDIVPGILTLAPAPPDPAPFPVAPGATSGPEPAPVLQPLSADAPVPSSDDVGALVAELAADTRLGPRFGGIVVDAVTGKTLGSSQAATAFTPASTQKLLTAVAALTELDPDATLDTTVYLDDNRLVLVGGGDMLLAAGSGDPAAVDGRAGLADLAGQVAAALRATGHETVTLAYDDSLFTGPAIAPAVPPEEAEMGFVAPVASMAVNQAMLGEGSWGPRAPDPARATAEAFAKALADQGVAVGGEITKASHSSGARVVGTVHSAPIREISGWAMARTDNTITEVLGRLVAIETGRPGSVEGATQAVLATVGSLGVDLDGAALVDCSGLGRGSHLTPRQLADVLLLTTDPAHPHLRDVMVDLPVGALSGTLASRFGGENAARGFVRAKTGSLPGIVGLAGSVVTADDRLLVFALTVDEVESGGTVGARMIFDQFVGRLAALGGPAAG
jgi:D-alanyl-D-alanine carboxypeptidase/D-alanyl-D-alanine-endopeptidase (penicillin-binding protein 4)